MILTLIGMVVLIWIYYWYQKRSHALLSQKIISLKEKYSGIQSQKMERIRENCRVLQDADDICKELCWKDYNKMCKIIDDYFYLLTSKLKQKSVLNEQEIRFCVLVFLDFNRQQIADTLKYAPSGIGKYKYRVAKKLGTSGQNLRNYLINIAVDEPDSSL